MATSSATPPEEAPPPPEPVSPPSAGEGLEPAAKGPGIKGIVGHPRFWRALSGVLAVLVIVVGLFSFVTISGKDKDLADTRASLSTEESARKAADAKVAALSTCIASMETDRTALQALYDDLQAVEGRVSDGGDWDTARLAYEAALKQSMESFNASWIDLYANDEAKFRTDYATALIQMESSKALATKLRSLGDSVDSEREDAQGALDKLEKQTMATGKQCTAALGGGAGADASVSPAPSATTD